MGLFGSTEKKICVMCEKVLKPLTTIESMQGKKSGNIEFADGWYCGECASQRKKKR